MQTQVLIQYFFPLALGVIMAGLGLSLSWADFKRVLQFPKAVVVGLGCQLLFLPLVCFVLVKVARVEPAIAVGFMLLAASPGGVTANLFSHLFAGDVALNITLTAVNSVLSALTLPLILSWSLAHLMGEGRFVPLDFSKFVQIIGIVVVPVGLGMGINKVFPHFASRTVGVVKVISSLFLLVLIAVAITKEFDTLAKYFNQIWVVALAFNFISLFSGYWLGRIFRLQRDQSIAIAMEVGVHNTGLAATIAASPLLLNDMVMAIPAAIYTVSMYFAATGFGLWMRRTPKRVG